MRTLVVSGSRDEYLRIWELDTAKCLHAIHAHKSPIWSVGIVVRSNGNVIVVSTAADGTMRTWNGKSGAKMMNFKGHTDKILSVFILNPLTEYPLLLSGGADRKLRVWELLTGAHIRMMEGHDDEITSIVAGTYTGISSLVVTSNTINNNNDNNTSSDNKQHNHDGKVTIIVSGCRDLTVRVWDFNTGHLIYELLGHTGCVYQVALIKTTALPTTSSSSSSSSSTIGMNSKVTLGKPIIISCSEDASVRLWDVANGKLIKKLKWHKVSVRGVDVMTIIHNNSDHHQHEHDHHHHHQGLSLIATCGWDKNIQIHELHDSLNYKEESYCGIS
jgi:WD40 repeat protein